MKIPTLEEVKAFFIENKFYNAADEAENCYWHYESTKIKGHWVRGSAKNLKKITNWKAVCHNWNRNAIKYAAEKGTYNKNQSQLPSGYVPDHLRFDPEKERERRKSKVSVSRQSSGLFNGE